MNEILFDTNTYQIVDYNSTKKTSFGITKLINKVEKERVY